MIKYIKNLVKKKNSWGYGNNNKIIFLKNLRKWLIILLLFVLLGIDISFAFDDDNEILYFEEEWEIFNKFGDREYLVIWGLVCVLIPVSTLLIVCIIKQQW